ncbi:hypothetical protein SH611_03405 [Geminicoccaceae bacterium 1502E]|nr:hypothetical protein [Geminicoccaceae bacterium 1502E]
MRKAEKALPRLSGRPRRLPGSLLAFIVRTTWRQQIGLSLLTLAVFPLSLAPLELQRRMVNEAVEDRDLELLLLLAGLYAAALLLHAGLKLWRNLYLGRTAEGVVRLLRRRIVLLHDRPAGDGDAAGEAGRQNGEQGTDVAILAGEAGKLGGFVGESIAFPLLNLGLFTSTIGYMLWVEPLVAAVAAAMFVPQLVVAPLVQKRINRRTEALTRAIRRLSDTLATPGPGEAGEQRLYRRIDYATRLRLRIYRLKYLLKAFNNLMGHMGPLAIVTVGGWLVIEGRGEVGTIVAFISGFERLADPARELLGYYRRLSQNLVQYRLVRDVIGRAPDARGSA